MLLHQVRSMEPSVRKDVGIPLALCILCCLLGYTAGKMPRDVTIYYKPKKFNDCFQLAKQEPGRLQYEVCNGSSSSALEVSAQSHQPWECNSSTVKVVLFDAVEKLLSKLLSDCQHSIAENYTSRRTKTCIGLMTAIQYTWDNGRLWQHFFLKNPLNYRISQQDVYRSGRALVQYCLLPTPHDYHYCSLITPGPSLDLYVTGLWARLALLFDVFAQNVVSLKTPDLSSLCWERDLQKAEYL